MLGTKNTVCHTHTHSILLPVPGQGKTPPTNKLTRDDPCVVGTLPGEGEAVRQHRAPAPLRHGAIFGGQGGCFGAMD